MIETPDITQRLTRRYFFSLGLLSVLLIAIYSLFSLPWFALLSSLASLILVGLLSFYPALKRLDKDGRVLTAANTELEARAKLLAESRLALKSQVQLSELILNSLDDGVVVVDREGKLLLSNPAAHSIFGTDFKGNPSCNFYQLVSEHVQFLDLQTQTPFESERDPLYSSLTGKVSTRRESLLLQHPGGKIQYVDVSAALLRDSDGGGKVCGRVLVLRNMTNQKRAEETARLSQELVTQAFRLTPLPIGIATLDGRFIEVNDCFVELVMRPREQVVGSTSLELGIWSGIEDRNQMVERLKTKGSVTNLPLVFRRKNVYRNLLGSFELIRWQGRLCVLGLVRDVTEESLAQRRLKEAKEAADKANLAKSEFLANISHEIRTPLAAVLGYLQMLEEQLEETSNGGRGCMSRIRFNTKTVLQLIDDILDISKVEAGKLDIECIEFELLAELSELFLYLRSQARVKGLELEVVFDGAIPRRICSDPIRLRQILMNLVGNAIKFTQKGKVSARLQLKEVRGESLLSFTISDTGCGIEASQRERLFQPFVQADSSTTRRFGGTGLGLSLSRQLAQALGGDLILLESVPGRGSTFEVSVAPGDLGAENLMQSVSPRDLVGFKSNNGRGELVSLEGVRVLLVEDGEDNQEVIMHFLKKAGAEVALAENGVAGFRKALSDAFDVILMDVQMPVLGGREATTRLRKAGYRGPIIALTAAAMKGERELCLEAGCDDYLTKPFEVNALLNMVKAYSGRRLPEGNQVLGEAGASQSLGEEPKVRKAMQDSTPIFSEFKDDPRISGIVKGFVNRLPTRVGSMEEALAALDWETLGRLAHQIKGAAGGYGYPSITQSAQAIELSVRDETPSQAHVAVLLGQFRSECERARQGVESLGA